MSSAVKVILGVSVLAMAAGLAACDNGGSDDPGPTLVAGSSNAGTGSTAGGAPGTGGTNSAGAAPTAGAAGSAVQGEGIPLTPVDGWVPVENDAKIQGAIFEYGDPTSLMGLTKDFTGSNACISGTAAKVDMASPACVNKTFTPPAMDCYGEYWGAAIGLNLNQAIDSTVTPAVGGTPAPYDASAIKGITFEISGDIGANGTPAVVPAPSALRFKVDNGDTGTEFCNIPSVKIKVGVNTVLFSEMVKECYKTPVPTEPLATTIQTGMIKIAWQVVTNDKATVPFNFCVSNIRAIK